MHELETRFITGWQRLMPHHRVYTLGEQISGWPDFSAKGISLIREWLQGFLDDLNKLTIDTPNLVRIRFFIQRELNRLKLSDCNLLATELNEGFSYLLYESRQNDSEQQLSVLQLMLRTCPEFIKPFYESIKQGAQFSSKSRKQIQNLRDRLCQLNSGSDDHLSRYFSRSDALLDLNAALQKLEELLNLDAESEDIESLEAAVGNNFDSFSTMWEARSGESFNAEKTFARISTEINRCKAQLERRCSGLFARYQQSGGSEETNARYVLDQLSLDQPLAEHWRVTQQNSLKEIHRILSQRNLLPVDVKEIILGYRRDEKALWPETRPVYGALKQDCLEVDLQDLSALEFSTLNDHLDDRGNYAVQILLASEVLPGRAWAEHAISMSGGIRSLLFDSSDCDTWALLAPEILLRSGWMRGEIRIRIFQLREKLRNLLLATADIELCLGLSDTSEVLFRLSREGFMPEHLSQCALDNIQTNPGRHALAVMRMLQLLDAEKKWKRNHGTDVSLADFFDLAFEYTDLPLYFIKSNMHKTTPGGRKLENLPPAILKVNLVDKDEVLRGIEQQLAGMGKIRWEDIDIGKEFDDQQNPQPNPTQAEGDTDTPCYSTSTPEETPRAGNAIMQTADTSASSEQPTEQDNQETSTD
jgi:hypothetical protein